MAITDWPKNERPREKLLQKGVSALSDAELLAIFLRTGIVGKSAVDLARELLSTHGGLRNLLSADRSSFCASPGIGVAKYCQLQAVVEMSRRSLAEEIRRGDTLSNPDLTRAYLRAQLEDLKREVFAALFLDNRNRVIGFEHLAEGTIDSATVHPREVVKRVLANNAAAVIFAHNHPSGVAEPSHADEQLTIRLRDSLRLIDVRLLDHFVVGAGCMVSFAERGLI